MPTLMASAPASISASRAVARRDVAGDHLHGVGQLLDPGDALQHAHGMAVRRVDDDHVAAGLDQPLGALEAALAGGRRRRHEETALIVLGGVRMRDLLLHVLDGDEADAAEMVVDDEQLLDAELVQEPLRLVLADALAHRDEPVLGHQLGDALARIGGEAHVAVGEDADQLALGAARPALDYGNAGDAVAAHDVEGIGEGLVGMDGDRVHHHAGFVFLDEAHLLGLRPRLEVAVDDAEAAVLGHGDGHRRLGDRVHGRGDDRQVQRDRAGQAGPDVDIGRQHFRPSRPQEHVVEGETLDDPIGGETGHATNSWITAKGRSAATAALSELARVRSTAPEGWQSGFRRYPTSARRHAVVSARRLIRQGSAAQSAPLRHRPETSPWTSASFNCSTNTPTAA